MASNRISYTIDPKDEADFMMHIKAAMTIGQRIIANSNKADAQTGQAMGTEGGWQYVGKAYLAIVSNREIFTSLDFNFDEFDKDYKLAEALIARWMTEVDKVSATLYLAVQLAGRDLMAGANKIRKRLQELGENYPAYQVLFEEVNFFYENRSNRVDKDDDVPK
jgi:hypothetical protein